MINAPYPGNCQKNVVTLWGGVIYFFLLFARFINFSVLLYEVFLKHLFRGMSFPEFKYDVIEDLPLVVFLV